MSRINLKTHILVFLLAIFLLAVRANGQIAAGGQYILEQSVIAAGGSQNMASGQYALAGTAGQSVAGQATASTPYSVYAGFWSAEPLFPTAAAVRVGGHVLTVDGRGIRNVWITMTGLNGMSQSVSTGAFGSFRFVDVMAGETYIFSVTAKRYHFSQATQIRTILEDTDDIDFNADRVGIKGR